jgi:plasmid stabilization system protein ParE
VSLPVVLRPEASRDAGEAQDYFDAQQAGRGQAFLDRLNEVLARIGALPEMYGIVWQNVRAARLRRFAYVVYYRVHDDRVEVLAVMQGSRDASAWQGRA